MTSVLIDTDIGDDIDDALALAFALRSPELDVLGVSTVFGDMRQRSRLARTLLATFGRPEVPVAEGADAPLAGRNRPSGCIQGAAVAADDALPPLYPGGATRLICESALRQPGAVTLICLGPLTNVAAALTAEPRLANALAGVTMMGSGAFPWAEWNTRNDPEALRVVVRSGVPLTVVGLNVTLLCTAPLADIRRVAALATPQAQLLTRLITLWRRGATNKRPQLHDPLTVAAVARPDLLTYLPARFGNVQEGPLRGWSCAWPSLGGRQRVALAVRRAAFFRLFAERVIDS